MGMMTKAVVLCFKLFGYTNPQNGMENIELSSKCLKVMGDSNDANEENQVSVLGTGTDDNSGAQKEMLSSIDFSGGNVNSSSNYNNESSTGKSIAIQVSHSIQSMLAEGTPDESNCQECDSPYAELSRKLEDKLLEENILELDPVVSVFPTTHEDLTADQIKSSTNNKLDASFEKTICTESLLDGSTLDSTLKIRNPNDLGKQIMMDLYLDDFQNIDSDKFSDIDSAGSEPLNSEECSDPSFFSELTGTEDANYDKLYGVNEGKSGIITNFQNSEPDSPTSNVNRQSTYYNPYTWTATEIETASGNAECGMVEHRLKLRSDYTDVEDVAALQGQRAPIKNLKLQVITGDSWELLTTYEMGKQSSCN